MASSDSEGNTNDAVKEPVPVPRKRGRPPKNKEPQLQEADDQQVDDPTPNVKRSPGRPKGARNKTQEVVENPEVDIAPKRARGRPRKWPPVEKPAGPKRKRGRPKKNPVAVPEQKEAEEDADEAGEASD